ncbi:MAG TPA: chromate efflux transporter [Herpetosiphonaceae bacterium]|nr:chromate efflux transporter [Herpetosiphonaceae bacterium]
MDQDHVMPDEPAPPAESYWRLFLRFLRFGCMAWGGPVAQIAMIRQELVEEERWASRERFNRVLSIYQALPGPEAHELCVHFGMLARGRLGGLLAGLGFMLPGFVLMFALSWFYVTYGVNSTVFAAVLVGFQPAVAALIVRAIHRIGEHALTDRWLWAIAVAAGGLTWAGVSFILVLLLAGLAYGGARWAQARPAVLSASIAPTLLLLAAAAPALPALFGYGLRTGLLTFGGAYTAIPFLQHDAVQVGGWMTDAQFLDGIALSGILPAPLIIFSTFVGYLGGGPLGALALTAGVFLPAFSFTLVGHALLERIIANRSIHAFLDGITAGVIGLIVVATAPLISGALQSAPGQLDWLRAAIFAAGLVVLYRWRSRLQVMAVVLGGGAIGLLSLVF